jgi:hypothetical protein
MSPPESTVEFVATVRRVTASEGDVDGASADICGEPVRDICADCCPESPRSAAVDPHELVGCCAADDGAAVDLAADVGLDDPFPEDRCAAEAESATAAWPPAVAVAVAVAVDAVASCPDPVRRPALEGRPVIAGTPVTAAVVPPTRSTSDPGPPPAW